jgi:methylenetetrahydrofolate dehydrogenase (NADP+)/methenyltetrahydrofolate cyclohydrolase
MATLIDGKMVAKKIRENLKNKISEENLKIKLAVILVGDDDASKVYVRNKSKACEDVGIEFDEHVMPESITQKELIDLIDKLNSDKSVNGILLQYPIPDHLDVQEAFNRIAPEKDVDGFNPVNVGLRTIGDERGFVSCTPLGIMTLLKEYNIDTIGKKAVVVGRSNIVGKPMATCLLAGNATVTTCHSKTKNLGEETKQADILVVAIGKSKFVKGDMVKPGAVVIDVGMDRDENGKLCGDVDFDEVSKIASYITPVPGGVGPMTVATLLENTVKAYYLQNK